MEIREQVKQLKTKIVVWAFPKVFNACLPYLAPGLAATMAALKDQTRDFDGSRLPPGVIRRVPPTRARQTFVPFPSTEISPGKGFTVVPLTLHRIFKGEKIIVEESVDGATSIVALFVGGKLQIGSPSGDGILSRAFKKESTKNDFILDTCEPGLDITFWVRNETDAPVKWSALIAGRVV